MSVSRNRYWLFPGIGVVILSHSFQGLDKDWSVGTEFRQLRLFDAEVADKSSMRRMMVDDVKRRHFIIDADVEVILL